MAACLWPVPRVVAWLSLAGITALISQGWGLGSVGHSATVTWQKDLPFLLSPRGSEEADSFPTFSQEGLLIEHGGPDFSLLQYWLTLNPGTLILTGPASVYLL